jgi:hypothetical protein
MQCSATDPGRGTTNFGKCLRARAQDGLDGQIQVKFSPSYIVQETLLEAFRGFATFTGKVGRNYWYDCKASSIIASRPLIVASVAPQARFRSGSAARGHG